MNPASAKIARWRRDPVAFVREVLGAEPDAWQVDVLNAAAMNMRLALKASKGVGKSTLLAWLIWWFISTRPHPKGVCTSITGDNLKDNLWAELAKWRHKSDFLKAAFTWTKERIFANDHPETWWVSARTWPRDADPQQQANTLAGIHADHVIFVVDEVGSIPDAVVATAEAGLANVDAKSGRTALLAIAGNPTELSGPLHRACTQERALWWVREISGDPDDPKRAPRVSIEWARQQIEKYGRNHPYVLVNVFGQFPPAASSKLVGADIASAASTRSLADSEWHEDVKILGVDVARFGDDRTVFQPRQGRVAFAATVLRNEDTMSVADHVAFMISRWSPDAVFVDQTGIGAGVVDRLRQLRQHVVVGVDSSSSPLQHDASNPRFANRRAEMWWEMAKWLKTGCVPNDGELIAELTEPTVKYPGGKVLLESKDDIKRRGRPSPDKADALALTFAAPVAPRARLPGQLGAVQFAVGSPHNPHEKRST